MTKPTICKMSGSQSQPKGPLEGSASLPLEEILPASFRLWILKIGERASVDLAVFYGASVYKKPSSLHVLMCYINALKSRKTGNISQAHKAYVSRVPQPFLRNLGHLLLSSLKF